LIFSHVLSQWDLLIIAGSLVVIVSTSYYRPETRTVRAAYLLFVPAWSFLAFSVYQGINVQGSYVAYLVAIRGDPGNHKKLDQIASAMETATRNQIRGLEFALMCLALWLLVSITWWVFSQKVQRGGDDK
jgi:hypothetical protein